jgi:hypothetical protein
MLLPLRRTPRGPRWLFVSMNILTCRPSLAPVHLSPHVLGVASGMAPMAVQFSSAYRLQHNTPSLHDKGHDTPYT